MILCFDGLPTRFPAALAARARPILRTAPDLHRVATPRSPRAASMGGRSRWCRRLASAIQLIGDASWRPPPRGRGRTAPRRGPRWRHPRRRRPSAVVACVNAAAAARAADEDALARGDGPLVAAAFVKVV